MKVTFDGVSAAYYGKSILENVSFSVESGSITALMGRNGAGKSTLIRCLMGEKRDYSGSILLDGENVRSIPRQEIARKVACLPQILPSPHVTVEELVAFGRTPHTPFLGQLSALDREKVAWAIHAVGMEGRENAFVDTLSGGERKKAFFAMTLAQDTPLLVLDEPTAHLDTASRFAFLQRIEEMGSNTGKTFLLVMHELPEVLSCAHRIGVLHEGALAFCGTPKDCLAAEIPERCFGISVSGSKEQGFAVRLRENP